MKIACISLGCPKNQVDLDVMVHILLSAGHETVADLADADVILCSRILSAPGKWLQRLTTNEPDDSMIECAIRALELVIPEQKGSDAW